MLFIYTKNNRGPNALPRGMPPHTKPHDKKESLYLINTLETIKQVALKPHNFSVNKSKCG